MKSRRSPGERPVMRLAQATRLARWLEAPSRQPAAGTRPPCCRGAQPRRRQLRLRLRLRLRPRLGPRLLPWPLLWMRSLLQSRLLGQLASLSATWLLRRRRRLTAPRFRCPQRAHPRPRPCPCTPRLACHRPSSRPLLRDRAAAGCQGCQAWKRPSQTLWPWASTRIALASPCGTRPTRRSRLRWSGSLPTRPRLTTSWRQRPRCPTRLPNLPPPRTSLATRPRWQNRQLPLSRPCSSSCKPRPSPPPMP
mmetsp:Transcript_24902/g.94167  ORF Transcript_24902/g.94167 Transcript_24902/m.94167 type:complete len:250 (-) Transcript_24902:2583-3332(-)